MARLLAPSQKSQHDSPNNRCMHIDVERCFAKSEMLGAHLDVSQHPQQKPADDHLRFDLMGP